MSALAIVLDTKLSSHSTPKPASVLDNGNLVSICLSLLRHLIRSQSGMHSTSLCAWQGTQWWAASIWWMTWVICSWRCCLRLFCSNVTWPGLFCYLDGNYGMTQGQWQKGQSPKVESFWNMKELLLYVCRGLNCISFSTRSSTILKFLPQMIQDSWAMVPHAVGYWAWSLRVWAKVGKWICSRRGVRILMTPLSYPWASYQTPKSAEHQSSATY